jgi:hypothetical protein
MKLWFKFLYKVSPLIIHKNLKYIYIVHWLSQIIQLSNFMPNFVNFNEISLPKFKYIPNFQLPFYENIFLI